MAEVPCKEGFTATSVCLSILAILAMCVFVQYCGAHVGMTTATSNTAPPSGMGVDEALPIPAMIVFGVLLVVGSLCFALLRLRLLSKAELVCVLFSLLIATPMMGRGFWQNVVRYTNTLPVMGYFNCIDAMPPQLWPHGPNLLAGTIASNNERELRFTGPHEWRQEQYAPDRTGEVLVLTNSRPGQVSSVRVRLPLRRDGKDFLLLNTNYSIGFLARATGLSAESRYYYRTYKDEQTTYRQFINANTPSEPTPINPQGFRRVGSYANAFLPQNVHDCVILEFALEGPGRLELADPQMVSTQAIEDVRTGKRLISRAEYDILPTDQRNGLIVRPDSWWSVDGLRYLLDGGISYRAWWVPIAAWGGLVLLVMTAVFCLNALFRRQWCESERYALPLLKIPASLLGETPEEHSSLTAFWKNRAAWCGFGLALIWAMVKYWHGYNPDVPDLRIHINIESLFNSSGSANVGDFWKTHFQVTAIGLSIALLLELNVLLSLVAGVFFYRLLFIVKALTPLKTNPDFPFAVAQQTGAMVVYALLILWFARKYLRAALRDAVFRDRPAPGGWEVFSRRTTLLLLAGTVVGTWLWSRWLGLPATFLLFFAFVVLVALTTSKFRAECGVPACYGLDWKVGVYTLFMVGSFQVFGPDSAMVATVASALLFGTMLMLVPGMQVEMMELGRRIQLKPRHVFYTCCLGILGGLVIGGWVFLSDCNMQGGETLRGSPIAVDPILMAPYQASLDIATDRMAGKDTALAGQTNYWWGLGIGGVVTTILVVLRQAFPGFWFHPVGYILGGTQMMDTFWGSALTAWCIRSIVLKMGGAATVRSKLIPFAVGMFVAAVLAVLLASLCNAYLVSRGVMTIYGDLP
jgi:hypothetical protein